MKFWPTKNGWLRRSPRASRPPPPRPSPRAVFRAGHSGGSAVQLLARGLAAPGAAANWHVFWTDERRVPLSDPQSNFRLAETELLPKLAGAQVHPLRGSAADCETELRPFLPLDLVLLGVGEDGHVASLFPGNPATRETQRLVADVHDAPKPPPERVTLTFPVLNAARETLVVASGAARPPSSTAFSPRRTTCPRNGFPVPRVGCSTAPPPPT
jgi:6-phosphogluconolactonase